MQLILCPYLKVYVLNSLYEMSKIMLPIEEELGVRG